MSTEERQDNTTSVIMKYFKGSQCPNDSSEEILTKVTFFCDETVGLGNPILQSIEHCEYAFDFPTNILCKDRRISMKSDGNSCELVNEKLNVSVDLRPIAIFEEESTKIDICDSSVKKTFIINYRQSMISVQFQRAGEFHAAMDFNAIEFLIKLATLNFHHQIIREWKCS
jgi:insulin-like growth factor 2 receptor